MGKAPLSRITPAQGRFSSRSLPPKPTLTEERITTSMTDHPVPVHLLSVLRPDLHRDHDDPDHSHNGEPYDRRFIHHWRRVHGKRTSLLLAHGTSVASRTTGGQQPGASFFALSGQRSVRRIAAVQASVDRRMRQLVAQRNDRRNPPSPPRQRKAKRRGCPTHRFWIKKTGGENEARGKPLQTFLHRDGAYCITRFHRASFYC